MTPPPANLAASIKQRLLNIARKSGEDFEQLLVRYAVERLLYRLSMSSHRRDFILKGAMLFVAWEGHPHRATRDLDLLGFGDHSIGGVTAMLADLCEVDAPEDGLKYERASIVGEVIRTREEYGGVRATMQAILGSARIRLQVDVGFGDAVTPAPEEIEYPTLLGTPRPKLRAYPAETVIAEKMLTIIELGLTNSRMKDYFDLLHLARTRCFEGAILVRALQATAARRTVTLPTSLPVGVSTEFADDANKQRQWEAFALRTRVAREWSDLHTVVRAVAEFAGPLVIASGAKVLHQRWVPEHAWTSEPPSA